MYASNAPAALASVNLGNYASYPRRDYMSISTPRTGVRKSGSKKKAEETAAQALCQSIYEKLSTKLTAAEDMVPRLSDDSMKILRKKHAERTDIEVEKIFRELSKMPFFSFLPDEQTKESAWLELVQRSDLIEDITKGTHVVNADNALEALFIILSGEVKAYNKNDKDAFDIKGRGDAFGELLPSKGNIWSQSVSISADGTALLRIDHYVSESVLRPLILKQQHARVHFLLSTRLFERWSESDVREVAELMHERRVKSNEVICKQGEPASDLFIIAKGHCRVTKEVSVPSSLLSRGFQRSPADTLEPVSSDMVSALQHLRQGRLFASRRHGVHRGGTAECAATLYNAELPALNQEARKQAQIQKRQRLLDAEQRELQSVRGAFVPSLARLALRRQRQQRSEDARAAGGGGVGGRTGGAEEAGGRERGGGAGKQGQALVRKNVVVQLRDLWRGSFFGELSILNKEAKTASVIAATPVQLLVLNRHDLYRHFDDNMLNWIRILGQDLEYAGEEGALHEALTMHNSWAEYRQAALSDSLFSRTVAERQGQWFADRVIQDPSQPMGPLSRPQTGPNSRQIRAMRVD